MRAGHIIRTTLLLAAIATVATACGRRPGSLDTPYEAAQKARAEAERNNEPLPPEPTAPVHDKPFILDRLL